MEPFAQFTVLVSQFAPLVPRQTRFAAGVPLMLSFSAPVVLVSSAMIWRVPDGPPHCRFEVLPAVGAPPLMSV